MRYDEVAAELDAAGDTVGAAWAYELAVAQDPREMELRLDLVALYVAASDTGFAAARHLDPRFVDVAYYRAKELLDDGLRLYPDHPELRAWRLHLDERVLGEPIDEEQLRALAGDPRARFARLLLYVSSGGREYLADAEATFRDAAARVTERQRYCMSYAPRLRP